MTIIKKDYFPNVEKDYYGNMGKGEYIMKFTKNEDIVNLQVELKKSKQEMNFFKERVLEAEKIAQEKTAQLTKSISTNASVNKRLDALQKALAMRFEMAEIDIPGKLLWIKLRGANDNQILNLQNCFDKIFKDAYIVVTDETVESIREFSEDEMKELAKFLSKSEEKKG